MAAINLRPSEFALAGKRIHYAWVIVVITSVMRLVSSSFRMGFPALIPLIAVEFGWQVWLVTLAFSLQWVVSGAFGPAAGWLGDRYGARVTMAIGATLYLVGMILTGSMSQPWHLILFFGIILSASMGIFQVPLTVSVTSWFRRHLGVGMGLLQGSQGLGPVIAIPIMLGIAAWFTVGTGAQFLNWGALSSPLLSWIPLGTPEILGIRMAFWIPGIVGGIILLLLIRIFYNTPEDIGLRQLGADANTPSRQAPATGATAKARASVFLRQVRKTPAFWNLIGIHYWGCAGHSIVIVFLPAMIISSLAPEGGWESITDDSARSAALLRASAIGGGAAAVMSLVSTFTRFGVPIAADLLGKQVGDGGLLLPSGGAGVDPAVRDTVLPGGLDVLPVCGVVRHRVRRRDVRVPHHQSTVLRQCPNRHVVRFPDDGSRRRNGERRPGGEPAAGGDRRVRGDGGAVVSDEPDWGGLYPVPADHAFAPTARMGERTAGRGESGRGACCGAAPRQRDDSGHRQHGRRGLTETIGGSRYQTGPPQCDPQKETPQEGRRASGFRRWGGTLS